MEHEQPTSGPSGNPYSPPPQTPLSSPPPFDPGSGASPQWPAGPQEIRTWSMLCHLSALAGLLVWSFGAVAGPLIVWLVKRNDHPIIDAHGKEALNFQLSIFLYFWVLTGIGLATAVFLVGFLFFALAFVVAVSGLVLAVVAAVKVSNGQTFRYPFTIRFLS